MKKNLVLTTLLLFCGCSSTTVITPSGDGPWASAGVHSQEKITRTQYAFAPLPATRCSWSTGSGHDVDAKLVVNNAAAYLVSLGYFDRWPKSGSGYDGIDQRVAPFTFHIISISPTIVVMVGHDFGSNFEKRSNTDILKGSLSGKRCTDTKYFINYFEYGDSFPDGNEVLWYSPGLGIPPTKIKSGEASSKMSIAVGGFQIELNLIDGTWRTKRVK